MDWPGRQGSYAAEHSGLPSAAIGVKLPGSISSESGDTTALFFNESVLLCKRELRNLSKSLQEEAIEILRQEANLILSDLCAQTAKECAKQATFGYAPVQQLYAPAPPPLAFPSHTDLKNSADLPIGHHRPFVGDFVGEPPLLPTGDPIEPHVRPSSPSSDASRNREEQRTSPNYETKRVSTGSYTSHKTVETTETNNRDQAFAKRLSVNNDKSLRRKAQRMGSTNEVLSKFQERFGAFQTQSYNELKRTPMGKIVMSDCFDYVFGFILVLNAITLGVQANFNAQNLGDPDPPIFATLDIIFCVAFVLELSLRLYVFKCAYYFMPGWQWAYFDTAIVSMQTFEEVMKLVEKTQNGGSSSDTGGGVFQVLKLLKVGRLLRMVRMVRLIPELKAMVYLIFASMSAFLWSLVLLGIMIYCIAVYLTMMSTEVLLEKGIDGNDDLESIYAHWGSVGDSIMSLYWSITGGQDWGDLIQPLVNESGQQIHNVIFAMYIAFATMVVMNLVTGVFVDGAQRLNKEDKDREVMKIASKTFNAVDDDDDVEISNDELNHHMVSGKMDAYLEAINLQRQECLDLFRLLDVDGSGSISLQEFTTGCMKLRGNARAVDVAQLHLDMREVKDCMIKQIDSLGTSCRSVVDLMTVWCSVPTDLGCEV